MANKSEVNYQIWNKTKWCVILTLHQFSFASALGIDTPITVVSPESSVIVTLATW